jgi:hypothetical protein
MHFLSRGNGVKVLPFTVMPLLYNEEKLRVMESYSGKIVDSDMSHAVAADDSERATRHATQDRGRRYLQEYLDAHVILRVDRICETNRVLQLVPPALGSGEKLHRASLPDMIQHHGGERFLELDFTCDSPKLKSQR